MNVFIKRGMLMALAAGIVMAGTPQAVMAQSAGKVIKERRALMKNNSKTNKIVRAFVKKGKGSAADVAAAGRQLASNAGRITALFVKGTSATDGVGKTRAKPAIWARWSEFEAAAGKLKSAGENLAKVASSGDTGGIKAAAGKVGKACGGCHKPFRAPKKKKK